MWNTKPPPHRPVVVNRNRCLIETCKLTTFYAAALVKRKEFLLIAVKNDVVDFGMFGP